MPRQSIYGSGETETDPVFLAPADKANNSRLMRRGTHERIVLETHGNGQTLEEETILIGRPR